MHTDFVCQCTLNMTLQLQFRLFRLKLSFRMLYDFDLNEAIDIYDVIT